MHYRHLYARVGLASAALCFSYITPLACCSQVRLKGPATVKATIDIYNTIRRELLPTPAKSHYTYNMRDLSKVFQGMQMIGVAVDDTRKLTRLWAHETLRVFHDRLVSNDDRTWFQNLMKEMVGIYWSCVHSLLVL